MKKLFLIGLKDVRLAFRDRAALVLMLLAPFALTVGLGFVTGRFSGSTSTGLSDIPVVIVNLDGGQLGDALVSVFNSVDLADLLEPASLDSEQAARKAIDADQFAAAVIIPAGFSESIIPTDASLQEAKQENRAISLEPKLIEVYVNPARPTGAGVVKTIVDEFISRVEDSRIKGMTSFLSIPGIETLPVDQIQALAQEMFTNTVQQADNFSDPVIRLKTDTQGAASVKFDSLAYMAPGMALMFLMYTVSYGGRSILSERMHGTLPRLLISPTTSAQILGGKVLGIFLTGVAQVGILILASSIFFQVKWGDFLAVGVLIAAAVFGATGWGMLITSLARSPGQVASVGSAIMLIFGLLGGSFISLEQMPVFIRVISGITPNAWGLDGFATLALGGTLVDIVKPVIILVLMGTGLFILSTVIFTRSQLMKK